MVVILSRYMGGGGDSYAKLKIDISEQSHANNIVLVSVCIVYILSVIFDYFLIVSNVRSLLLTHGRAFAFH